MSAREFDIAVVGGGPGGYATALRASGHGLRVAVIEAGPVGGTCLHQGCVPSKALLHVARLADQVPHLLDLGLASGRGPVDVEAAGRFRDRTVDHLHRGLQGLLRSRRIEVVTGRGRVTEPGVVTVEGVDGSTRVRASHIVVATGSQVAPLAGVGWDHQRVLSSDDALRLERVPDRGVVVGGGAVGVEFASLWRSLGAEVTVVEMADRILPLEDESSSTVLAQAFERRGIQVRTGTPVRAVEHRDGTVSVELDDGSIEADQVLVAVGRRPAIEGTGLDLLGLLDGRGFVKVDAHGRTAVEGIWAVGDVVPTLALAHDAFAEGFVVADAIARLAPEPVDHAQVPRVTYCSPEVASVGLTETQARVVHGEGEIQVTTTRLSGNARALIEGEVGQVKLVSGADGTLLGAHLVGPSATELVGEATLAVAWEATASELGAITHAHPTLAETIREAALTAAGLPFHR